jgi:serine/threonine-protein kinase
MTSAEATLRDALRDRYVLERELGRGGMGTVWLAQDLRHDRPVALKLLQPDLGYSLGGDRFLREIRLAARLQHPHILTVLDSGTVPRPGGPDLLWFTMPYVEGESLRSRLVREGQLTLADAVRITRDIAEALDYSHAHGVIHRDIKPENILLDGGHALVTDFGVARPVGTDDARLTETGVALGTPQYMSPEQAAGDPNIDRRSDVYALACVLYEMLAGEPPFTGPNYQAILAKRLRTPAPPVTAVREVPAAMSEAVARGLARSPADRYATAGELAAALEHAPSAPSVGPAPASRRTRWIGVAAAVVVLVVGAAVLVMRRSGGAAPAGPPTAAVLPFVDLSPGRDQEYFSDGLTDELITALSQVQGLRVAARTSSFQFKGRNADVREVGRRLGVGAVLEGSVRRAGNRLRVSAQLVSARDGYQLWSESYDRDPSDVFAVQEEIARAIVAALRLRLESDADSAFSSRPTGDMAAYDLFLKGQFALNQRTGPSVQQAARWFEQAVERDSTFSRAWAGLADASLLLPGYANAPPAASWARAKHAANRALALDPDLVDALTSLAYGTMTYEWDWQRAEEGFRAALAANPNYPVAHHWYGDFLAGRGRFDESLREMSEAHRLDPLSLQIGSELAWVYLLQHRHAEAEATMRQVLALDPNFPQGLFILGQIQIQQGKAKEAVATLARAQELGGFQNSVAAAQVAAAAAAGDTAGARRLLHDLEQRATREWVPAFTFATAHAALGDRAGAIAWLQRGLDQRDSYMPENFFDPMLDPIRSEPGYQKVLAGLGLAK